MKDLARPLLLAALACTLAACNTPDTVMANGAITLDGNQVTLRVIGASKAAIDADGTFTVDGKPVVTTPAERSLLAQYNQSVRSVHETGLAMGKAGVRMAAKAVVASTSSAPGNAGETAEAGAGQMQQLSLDICKAQASIKTAQDQLATQLASFKPYASIVSASDVADCESDAKD
jgi:hypothetical protein